MSSRYSEIYVRNENLELAIEWVGDLVGGLEGPLDAGDATVRKALEKDVRLVITPKMEEGPFGSILVTGNDLPWSGDEEMGETFHANFNLPVRYSKKDSSLWIELIDGERREMYWED